MSATLTCLLYHDMKNWIGGWRSLTPVNHIETWKQMKNSTSDYRLLAFGLVPAPKLLQHSLDRQPLLLEQHQRVIQQVRELTA